MSIFPKREAPPVDFDHLERDVTENLHLLPGAAPKQQPSKFIPLQIIAHAITKLTWKDAEAMGEAIKTATETNSTNLTAAIQRWAAGWESFTDE